MNYCSSTQQQRHLIFSKWRSEGFQRDSIAVSVFVDRVDKNKPNNKSWQKLKKQACLGCDRGRKQKNHRERFCLINCIWWAPYMMLSHIVRILKIWRKKSKSLTNQTVIRWWLNQFCKNKSFHCQSSISSCICYDFFT